MCDFSWGNRWSTTGASPRPEPRFPAEEYSFCVTTPQVHSIDFDYDRVGRVLFGHDQVNYRTGHLSLKQAT
jgi:hypothetical protein